MKITKLVIRFNRDKIFLGLGTVVGLTIIAVFVSPLFRAVLLFLAFLIGLNIALALYASNRLYDRSRLYRPVELLHSLAINPTDRAIFLHASFDPISRELEKLYSPGNLKIYNIYGNRHEDEASVAISNREFPPHPDQVVVNPTNLPDADDSIDHVLVITSAHEILTQEKRIAFFREARRVLRPDGRLVLAEQMRDWRNFLFFNIGAFHFVKLSDWEAAIAAAGLCVERRERLTFWGEVWYVSVKAQ